MTSVSRKKEIKKCIDIDIDIDIVNTTRARARTTNDGVILIVANTISIAATHYTKIIEHEIKRGGGTRSVSVVRDIEYYIQ